MMDVPACERPSAERVRIHSRRSVGGRYGESGAVNGTSCGEWPVAQGYVPARQAWCRARLMQSLYSRFTRPGSVRDARRPEDERLCGGRLRCNPYVRNGRMPRIWPSSCRDAKMPSRTSGCECTGPHIHIIPPLASGKVERGRYTSSARAHRSRSCSSRAVALFRMYEEWLCDWHGVLAIPCFWVSGVSKVSRGRFIWARWML